MGTDLGNASESLQNASEDLEMITSPRYWASINITNLITSLIVAGIIFAIGYVIINILLYMLKRILKGSGASSSGIYYIEKIAKFLLYFFLIVIIANTIGLQTNSLIAIVISIGVALALAMRDSLTDLASGIMVILTKPVAVGDRVYLDDIDAFLEVIEIRLFETRLRNRQNIIYIVPNSKLMSNNIENLSQEPFVKVDVRVGVSYDSDLKKVRRVITETLDKEDRILSDDADYFIAVEKLAESSINFLISFPVRPEHYKSLEYKINEDIRIAFAENDIEIPYPHMDLNIKNNMERKASYKYSCFC